MRSLLLDLLDEVLELLVHARTHGPLALLLLELVRVVARAARLVERVARLHDLYVELHVLVRGRGRGKGRGRGRGRVGG